MNLRQPPYDPRAVAHRLADLVVRRNHLLNDAQKKISFYHDLLVRIQRVVPPSRLGPPRAPDSAGLAQLQALVAEVEELDEVAVRLDQEQAELRGTLKGFLPSLQDRLFGGKREARLAEIDSERVDLAQYRAERVAEIAKLASCVPATLASLPGATATELRQLVHSFTGCLDPYLPSVISGWLDPRWQTWQPGTVHLSPILRVGQWSEDQPMVHGGYEMQPLNEALRDAGLAFSVPAVVPFIGGGKTIVLTCSHLTESLLDRWMHGVILRIAGLLAHQATFTLLDPGGQGRAFSMRQYIPRITENRDDLHADLRGVLERIARVSQQVLLNSKEELHQLPDRVLYHEAFEFIFAANFPRGYGQQAAELLFEIGRTGPRAGRYLFITHNKDQILPRGITWEPLDNCVMVDAETGPGPLMSLQFEPDLVPEGHQRRQVLERLGLAAAFDHVSQWINVVDLPEVRWWKEEVRDRIATPLGGENGSLKVSFGSHGWLAAMPEQGEVALLRGMLLGLAIRYPPADLRIYLVEGRYQAEFEVFRDLPHMALISHYSDPELARSVIAELVQEADRRADLFAQHGAADFAAHRDMRFPGGRLPRLLLILTAAEELFEDGRPETARQQLLQLLQQGSRVGVHVLMVSRSFAIPSLHNPETLLDQISLRLALRLPEQPDPVTVFGPEGRGLIRECDAPGKIVVNDAHGKDGSNVRGWVARLPDDPDFVPNRVKQLAEKARHGGLMRTQPRVAVYPGISQPLIHENPQLKSALLKEVHGDPDAIEGLAREPSREGGFGIYDWDATERPLALWMGQRYTVHDHAMMVLRRKPAQHAILVGEDIRARYGMLAGMLGCIPVLYTPKEIQVLVFDRSTETSPEGNILPRVCETVLRPLGYPCLHTREPDRLDPTFARLVSQIEDRIRTPGDKPSILVVLTEPERMPLLRRPANPVTDPLPAAAVAFHRLLAEGSQVGIYFLVAVASLRLPGLLLDPRYELKAFGHRVALQMSEDDSFLLVNSRHAGHLQKYGSNPLNAWYHAVQGGLGDYRFRPYDAAESLGDLVTLLLQIARQRVRT